MYFNERPRVYFHRQSNSVLASTWLPESSKQQEAEALITENHARLAHSKNFSAVAHFPFIHTVELEWDFEWKMDGWATQQHSSWEMNRVINIPSQHHIGMVQRSSRSRRN